MLGKAIIVVGRTGSGKSTIIKEKLIAGIHPDRLFIYDVQGEYKHIVNDFDRLPDIKEFTNLVCNVTESVIVFEEATIFFGTRGNDAKMRNLLVSKRHDRNTIILVFHSIRSIPYYIYDLVNYVYLLHTNDNEKIVETRHELLFEPWKEVMNMEISQYPRISYKLVTVA